MTWTAFHRRGDVLRAVVDDLDARRDGVLPMDLPGVAETFRDEIDLLGAVHLKWHARLSGNIERALMEQPLDLEGAVAAAWQRTSEDLPGIRAVLDHYTAHPTSAEMATVLERAHEKEYAGLARAAGLSSDDGPRSVAIGRRVAERGRAGLTGSADAPTHVATVPSQPVADDEPDSPSLVERIRAVLTA